MSRFDFTFYQNIYVDHCISFVLVAVEGEKRRIHDSIYMGWSHDFFFFFFVFFDLNLSSLKLIAII